MYLHDVADMEVSFTKDDMHLGRHNEYERKLAEQLLGPSSKQPPQHALQQQQRPGAFRNAHKQ